MASQLFDQAHYHLRCGITIPMKRAGDVHFSDGTVKTVQQIEEERANAAAIAAMSDEEKAALLAQLLEES